MACVFLSECPPPTQQVSFTQVITQFPAILDIKARPAPPTSLLADVPLRWLRRA
jgi:hypothetical protein